jgi:DNA repair protein RadC
MPPSPRRVPEKKAPATEQITPEGLTLARGITIEAEQSGDSVIAQALTILRDRLRTSAPYTAPQAVHSFLCLQAAQLTCEVFAVMFLDASHRLIAYEPMFRGTLKETAVYPREVARRALALNAAAVILHHNHPSGDCTPSDADVRMTDRVQDVLRLIDVVVLDHVITGGDRACSLPPSPDRRIR